MITDNEMAIGGHYEYLPKADTVTLREIVEDRERRYESRFRWEAQDELRRRAFAIMHGERAAQPGTPLEQREQYISELRAEKAELAAENERLRGLLAGIISAVDKYDSDGCPGLRLLHHMGAATSKAYGRGEYARLSINLTAAIEAAKEASNAQ